MSFRRVAPVLLAALRRLDLPGEDEDRLAESVGGSDNGSLTRWRYYVERLSRRGLLCHSVRDNGTRLATLVAVSTNYTARPTVARRGFRYVLSRFAYLRVADGKIVVESPLAHCRVILNDCSAAAVVCALAAPALADELAAKVASLSTHAVFGVLTLLLRAGMLAEADAEGRCSLDQDAALQSWAFHDLVFHARSRTGRFDAPLGATYRLAGQMEPPPAVKPIPLGTTFELQRPDLTRLERDDAPLARVMERRCSTRDFDVEQPITRRQLGEFLFRVARVRSCRREHVATPHGSIPMEFALRPYPAGGALYELELYAAVNHCVNLESGLYHYDPSGHRLTRLGERAAEIGALLKDAAGSTGIPDPNLQVLIILAARIPRVAWKYESIAYSLTLKHVGVLFQTMYLAATAMGLGACAVGGGDSDLFTRATGIDYCTETSVGEFVLGSKRKEPTRSNR
jgi:SagB-type dehydrogenase family enzyme